MSATRSLHAPASWGEWQQIAILAGAGEAGAEDAPEVHRAAWLAARASVVGEHEGIGPLVLIRMAREAAVEAIGAERRRRVMTPILDASERNLPACPLCGAWRGDPCRKPGGGTTAPHKVREELAAALSKS